MKARAYLRVSTEEQAAEGFSLAAQEERCRQFIESQGWEYDGEYIDDGYSAKDLNRPAMQRLIADVKDKAFDILVFYRLDRLVRSVMDLHHLIRLFDEHNVKFKSVSEVFDTTSASGRLFINIIGSLAEWERENLGERVRMGMERRAAEGKWNGSMTPYGYRVEDGRLVVDPEEAKVVRRIFNLYKRHGLFKIANILNEEGIPSSRGTTWHPNSIQYVIQNPIYTGKLQWGLRSNKTQVITVEGAVEPIISEEEFEEVQQLIKKRRNMPARGKSTTNEYLFTGILVCGHCEAKMYGFQRPVKGKPGRKSYYYRCTNRYKQWKNCPMPQIDERVVVQEMFRVIEWVANQDEVEPPENQEKEDAAIRRRELEKQLEAVKRRRKKWQMAYAEDVITLDELRERMREESEREETILKELEELGHEAAEDPPLDKETFMGYVQDLTRLWDQLERREQKELVNTIFRRIVIVAPPGQPKHTGAGKFKRVEITDYELNVGY